LIEAFFSDLIGGARPTISMEVTFFTYVCTQDIRQPMTNKPAMKASRHLVRFSWIGLVKKRIRFRY
jgi:hypothetical protein